RGIALVRRRAQHKQRHRAQRQGGNAVPRDETSDPCRCHAQRYGAHRLHDLSSLLGISWRPDARLDPSTPNGLAVGTFELHGESLVDAANFGRRVDRSRVAGNDRRRQGWVSCSELNCDHGSEAVADYDRPRDPDLRAKPGKIVGEARQVVAALGPITATAAAQIKPCYRVRRLKVLELRLEEAVVATPAVDEDERRISASSLLVIQAEVVPPRVRHVSPSEMRD